MHEPELRTAVENLMNSTSTNNTQNVPPNDLSHSHSINTIASIRPEYVITDDIFSGMRMEGRMSSIRRFFCLFITFDLLFVTLMWLICIMLDGDNIMTALKKQIYHYNVHSSLFDIVMMAIFRFVVLLLFYALLDKNHWSIIAVTTTSTCAFLISKVFVYEWQTSNQPVFQVLLVLISFVLSWGEAWFLDFRVIPQEYQARQLLISSPDTERAPLIRSYVQGLPSMYTESVGNFYSPLGTPEGSIHSEGVNIKSSIVPVKLSTEQERDFKRIGRNILTDSWKILHRTEWKKFKTNNEDTIETMNITGGKGGKIFKLTGTIPASPRYALEELFYNVEKITDWNKNLLDSRRVQIINENTDITYQITAEGANGMVTSRDFVNLRSWDSIDGTFVIAFIGVEHPSIPKTTKYIRGENGEGSCMTISPIANDPTSCTFTWVVNINLRGWIPQTILDAAYGSMMFEYIKNLRSHINMQLDQANNSL